MKQDAIQDMQVNSMYYVYSIKDARVEYKDFMRFLLHVENKFCIGHYEHFKVILSPPITRFKYPVLELLDKNDNVSMNKYSFK